MKYCIRLLLITCFLMTACSSDAKDSFAKIVSGVDKYFTGQPSLLTSTKIMKDGQQTHAYFALKIDKCNLSYGIESTYLAASPYKASINLHCNVLDNLNSGDIVSNFSEFEVTSEIATSEASGFSTTSMALANNDFSSNNKSVTFIMRYSYQGDNWNFTGMTAGGAPESLIRDLETFPQNKLFRKAIGMNN